VYRCKDVLTISPKVVSWSRHGGDYVMVQDESNWITYDKVKWNSDWCKRCHICVEACPEQALVLDDHVIIQTEKCNKDGVCQRFCPDLAIEVIEPREKAVKR